MTRAVLTLSLLQSTVWVEMSSFFVCCPNQDSSKVSPCEIQVCAKITCNVAKDFRAYFYWISWHGKFPLNCANPASNAWHNKGLSDILHTNKLFHSANTKVLLAGNLSSCNPSRSVGELPHFSILMHTWFSLHSTRVLDTTRRKFLQNTHFGNMLQIPVT